MWTDRTELLIGEQGVKTLEKANVAVIGVGGVGGATVVMLARAGIGNFTIIDFDVVDETNINRQFVANTKTLGKAKVDILKTMILEINPLCNVKTINERVTQENVEKIKGLDYVVDAIDSVQDKVELICHCKQNGLNIISAMGAGNRLGIPNYVVTDIYKTSNDGLAKSMRKKLRERGISSLDVALSTDLPMKAPNQNAVGSISYHPTAAACVIAAHVVNRLLDNAKNTIN